MKKERKLVYRIYPKKTIKKIEGKIKLLGINCKYDTMKLLNIRLLISILLFGTILIISKQGYILSPIITILFYFVNSL